MDDLTYLGGKAEVSYGTVTVGAEFLGEIHVQMQEGTRSTNSLAGVINTPSGSYDTAQATLTMILPSMDALKAFLSAYYEAPTGEASDLSGRVRFGSGSCKTLTPAPFHIHYTCEDNSDNDVHFYAALIACNFDATWNESDSLTVEVTVYPQPTSQGYGFVGAGDLTQKTLWDASTQSFIPVSES